MPYNGLMNTLQVINASIITVGIPSLVAACIYTGRKFNAVETLESFIKDDLKPELKGFRDHAADTRIRLSVVETKLDGFTQTRSPISLTSSGKRLLKESGLRSYIDGNKDLMIAAVTDNGQVENPYDIQQSAAIFFDGYQFPNEVEDDLKKYAYDHGVSLDVLLRIGAIYLRDICLKALDI